MCLSESGTVERINSFCFLSFIYGFEGRFLIRREIVVLSAEDDYLRASSPSRFWMESVMFCWLQYCIICCLSALYFWHSRRIWCTVILVLGAGLFDILEHSGLNRYANELILYVRFWVLWCIFHASNNNQLTSNLLVMIEDVTHDYMFYV